MNCEHVKPSLSLYLDSELAHAQASEIAAHLLSCSSCGAEHDALKRISRLVRDLPLMPLPAGFFERLDRRRHGESPAAASWTGPLPLAAAAAALVGLVVLGPWRSPRLARAPGDLLPPSPTTAPAMEKPVESKRAAKNAGVPYGAESGVTNEQLYKGLQAESHKLGLSAAPAQEEPASEPFLGDKLGQPGTREQAEAAIRQFSAMRRSIEESSGKPRGVAIGGGKAPALTRAKDASESVAPGKALDDGYWSGEHSGGNEGTRTVEDESSWNALWRTLSTSAAPPVDFASAQVVAVFLGPRPTGGYSLEFTEITRTAHALVVRYREHAPPPGQSAPEGATSPYALKTVSKTDLPVRFEKVR